MSDDWKPNNDNKAPPPTELKASASLGGAELKRKSLSLTWIAVNRCYRIRLVSNTGLYKPDQWLDEAGVKVLASLPDWEFTVDSPDYLGIILGLIKGAALI